MSSPSNLKSIREAIASIPDKDLAKKLKKYAEEADAKLQDSNRKLQEAKTDGQSLKVQLIQTVGKLESANRVIEELTAKVTPLKLPPQPKPTIESEKAKIRMIEAEVQIHKNDVGRLEHDLDVARAALAVVVYRKRDALKEIRALMTDEEAADCADLFVIPDLPFLKRNRSGSPSPPEPPINIDEEIEDQQRIFDILSKSSPEEHYDLVLGEERRMIRKLKKEKWEQSKKIDELTAANKKLLAQKNDDQKLIDYQRRMVELLDQKQTELTAEKHAVEMKLSESQNLQKIATASLRIARLNGPGDRSSINKLKDKVNSVKQEKKALEDNVTELKAQLARANLRAEEMGVEPIDSNEEDNN